MSTVRDKVEVGGQRRSRFRRSGDWSLVRPRVQTEIQELVREGLPARRIETRLSGHLNAAERDYMSLLANVRDSLRRGGPGGDRKLPVT
jgi:hypothetical protein